MTANTGTGRGGRRPGSGQPRRRFTFRRDIPYVVERQSPGELNPFHPPEIWRVLSVGDDEIEFQATNDDIIVIRLTDSE